MSKNAGPRKNHLDFVVTNHGSVWGIKAISPEAVAFAQDELDLEPWQGRPEHFFVDWRPARDLVKRLISEGWRVR